MPPGSDVSSEVSAAIRRALRPGASPFARLDLPEKLCETKVLRRAYRTAALLVHPDKCAHPEAKMAFQKLSEAFDLLSAPEGQKRELDRPRSKWPKGPGDPGVYPGRPYQHGGRYDRPAPPGCWGEHSEEGAASEGEEGPARGGKSWWDAGFSEFEKRLRAREAEELRKEAMEAALRRGEDSLDAYMSVLEAELSGSATADTQGAHSNQGARGTKRSQGFPQESGIPRPGTRQNMPSFSMGRKPFRGQKTPAASASSCSSASTQMADVLLGHLDSDGSELSD
eukprot:Skav234275  [mRNA]  locus=scaffold1464:1177821:1178666:+ [translate_table: standard]